MCDISYFSLPLCLGSTSIGLGPELNSGRKKNPPRALSLLSVPRGELNSAERRFIHRDNANSHS